MEKFKFWILLLLLWHGYFIPVFGTNLDSLRLIWKDDQQTDSIRFQALYDIIYPNLFFSNPDSALVLAQEILDQATNKNNLYWQGSALKIIGLYYSIQSDPVKSLAYSKESLEKFMEGNYLFPQAGIYNNIGLTYHFLGDYLNAIKEYQKGLEIVEKLKINDRIKWSLIGNLSKLHEDLGDYDLALTYIQEVIEKGDEQGLVAGAYHSLASIYYKMEDYKNAEKSILLSIEKNLAIDNKVYLAFGYLELGKIKIKTSEYTTAQEVLLKANNVFQVIGNKQYLASTYAYLGIAAYHTDQSHEGMKWCNRAWSIVNNSNFLSTKEETCRCLYYNQKKLGDYKNALAHLELLNGLNDSLVNVEKVRTAAKMQMQFNFDLEKKSMEAEQNKVLLAAKLKQRDTTLGYTILIGCLLLSFLAASIIFQKINQKRVDEHNKELQDKNQLLINKNKELERFAFITSHDLKEPVRTISAFTDLLKKRIDQPDREEYLGYIKTSAKKMYYLIESIMAFTKVSHTPVNFEQVNLSEIIKTVEENLAKKISETGVNLEYGELPEVVGIKSQLIILFQNLIENAIKYNDKEDPRIKISWHENKKEYLFEIRDNGLGIEKQYLDKIFEPFSKLNNHYEGAGLGLSISKNIVQHHKGEIWVASEQGIGSTFCFSISKDLEASKKDNYLVISG